MSKVAGGILPYSPINIGEVSIKMLPEDFVPNTSDSLWYDIEMAQRWNGFRMLGIDTGGHASPIERYTERSEHNLSTLMAEAETRLAENDRYTDKRNVLSLAAFFAVQADDPSVLHRDFHGLTLDVGSGAGELTRNLEASPIAQVIELDFSIPTLKNADKKSGPARLQVNADGTVLPFDAETFDQTVSMFSTSVHTETIRSRLNGLTEVLRVTKVGGRSFVVPLISNMILNQQRWHKLEHVTSLDQELEDFKSVLRREAAIDYAQTLILRKLMEKNYVELTPVLCHSVGDNGVAKDVISGIFDIKKSIDPAYIAYLTNKAASVFKL